MRGHRCYTAAVIDFLRCVSCGQIFGHAATCPLHAAWISRSVEPQCCRECREVIGHTPTCPYYPAYLRQLARIAGSRPEPEPDEVSPWPVTCFHCGAALCGSLTRHAKDCPIYPMSYWAITHDPEARAQWEALISCPPK